MLGRLVADLHERAIASVGADLDLLRAKGHLPDLNDVRLPATLSIEMRAAVPRLRAMLNQPLPSAKVEQQAQAAVDRLLAGTVARIRRGAD